MKKTYQGPFTLKQQTLEIIRRLYIKCVFLDTEHLFILPKPWLEYLQYEEVDVEISENLCNANCMPKYFFAEKDFESWDPKFYGPRNYLQGFYVPLSFKNAGPIRIIHLQCL